MKTIELKVFPSGAVHWLEDGDLHRGLDQPAVIYANQEVMVWYKYGKCHRDNNKPAVIEDGNLEWFFEGKFIKDNSEESNFPEW